MGLYNPTDNLLEGIREIFPLELCPWDDYYTRMAQTDFLCGRQNLQASKTFFFRKAPFNGSYAILGGLTAFMRTLQDYQFNNDVAEALEDQGYRKEFINFLVNTLQRINVAVSAPPEGSVILPNEPAVVWEGDLISVRIAEGIALKCLNYPTLSMTKWHRVCLAAKPGMVMEFARRRAQDDLRTSLYAHLAGVDISSNSEIRRGFRIPVTGTMGHEFIQSFGDEFEAFDRWIEHNPDRPTLLIDTIDTLKSGLPNAIRAFKKHRERIEAAKGIMGVRNDSGDLAYITMEERIAFLREDMPYIRIFETNDLDEYSIEAIRGQIYAEAPKAGLDTSELIRNIVWACGTNPGTCSDQSSLGGVAKLTSIEKDGVIRPVIKIARDNPIKTSIPGLNRSAYIWKGDVLVGCLIYARTEVLPVIAVNIEDHTKIISLTEYKLEPRHSCQFTRNVTLKNVRDRVRSDTDRLHWTYKRFVKPNTIPLYLSPELAKTRKNMIDNNRLI
jgi:nicotinate phosphoribosyltransferase